MTCRPPLARALLAGVVEDLPAVSVRPFYMAPLDGYRQRSLLSAIGGATNEESVMDLLESRPLWAELARRPGMLSYLVRACGASGSGPPTPRLCDLIAPVVRERLLRGIAEHARVAPVDLVMTHIDVARFCGDLARWMHATQIHVVTLADSTGGAEAVRQLFRERYGWHARQCAPLTQLCGPEREEAWQFESSVESAYFASLGVLEELVRTEDVGLGHLTVLAASRLFLNVRVLRPRHGDGLLVALLAEQPDLLQLARSTLALSAQCGAAADRKRIAVACANAATLLAYAGTTGLVGMDLSGVVLADADLSEAVMEDCVLAGTDLSGAALRSAWLVGADASEALLGRVTVDECATHAVLPLPVTCVAVSRHGTLGECDCFCVQTRFVKPLTSSMVGGMTQRQWPVRFLYLCAGWWMVCSCMSSQTCRTK